MEHDKLAGITQQVAEKFGKIDILVNNAHASRMSSIEEMTQEDSDYITGQTIMVDDGSIKLR
jgi:NAD(P)-dependent dehydrogenase (short-subunit alcohol dehydrogenase family)